MGRFFKVVIGTIASVVLGETAREVLKDIFKHALYGGIIENIKSAVGLKAADMVVQIVSHVVPIGIAGLVVWIVWTVAIAYERRAHSIFQINNRPLHRNPLVSHCRNNPKRRMHQRLRSPLAQRSRRLPRQRAKGLMKRAYSSGTILRPVI